MSRRALGPHHGDMHPEMNLHIAQLRVAELDQPRRAPQLDRPSPRPVRGFFRRAPRHAPPARAPTTTARPPPTSPGGARPQRSRPACRLTVGLRAPDRRSGREPRGSARIRSLATALSASSVDADAAAVASG